MEIIDKDRKFVLTREYESELNDKTLVLVKLFVLQETTGDVEKCISVIKQEENYLITGNEGIDCVLKHQDQIPLGVEFLLSPEDKNESTMITCVAKTNGEWKKTKAYFGSTISKGEQCLICIVKI